MSKNTISDHITAALEKAASQAATVQTSSPLPQAIQEKISALFTSGTETTQLVGLTNVASVAAKVQSRATLLQAQAGGIDLRSYYKKTTRPFILGLAQLHGVKWNPSADPYVSHPYREDEIDAAWVGRRAGRLPGAADLCDVLQYVDSTPVHADAVLECMVGLLLGKMEERKIDYRIPPRLTVPMVASLADKWLAAGVGGNRLEVFTVAVLRAIGVGLGNIWTEVTSHHINDPTSFDALCMDGAAVRMIVEVKDQPLELNFVDTLVDQAIQLECQRCILVTRAVHVRDGLGQIDQHCADFAALGVRVQTLTVESAIRAWLTLIDVDDTSLPRFVKGLVAELEERGTLEERTDFAHQLRKLVANMNPAT